MGKDKKTDFQAQVVVVGGGASGLAAAATALENGIKSVFVIEKRNAVGGNGVFAGGAFAIVPTNNYGLEDLIDSYFKKAMNYSHWKTNPKLIRALLWNSSDVLTWLKTKGLRYELRRFGSEMMLPLFVSNEKTGGAAVVKALAADVERRGGEIFTGTSAVALLKDKNNRVNGVVASKNGGLLNIKTRSVILATGGFAGNRNLMEKYFPYCNYKDYYIKGLKHSGDGINMALAAGAASEGNAVLEMDGPDFPWSPYFFSRISAMHYGIWLNKHGERFTDESVMNMFENAHSLERQPGKISYTIFDENIKRYVYEEALSQMSEMSGKDWPEKVEKDLHFQMDKGRVRISSSWGEIAGWMGIDEDKLKATVERYNSYCNKGHDDDFAKDKKALIPLQNPPFYAVRCCLSILVTHGGIKVNHLLEALDQNNDPIPGLYAAGVEIAGREANTYNSALPGHSFGFSIQSGRIAGENAAKYVSC